MNGTTYAALMHYWTERLAPHRHAAGGCESAANEHQPLRPRHEEINMMLRWRYMRLTSTQLVLWPLMLALS
jgi:hypothetical protein